MIVTGQHSFPFSSMNDGENGTKLFPETGDGLSFAELLGRNGTQYEIALDSEENRRVEILSESVLNENNGYQVVVGENGNPVTEIRETAEYASQAVADAGAPDSDPAEQNTAVQANRTAEAENEKQSRNIAASERAVSAENRESRPEKTAVDGHPNEWQPKQPLKKNDTVKTSLREKEGSAEKVFLDNTKGGTEESVKASSLAGKAQIKKTVDVSKGETVREGVKAAVLESGEAAATRLERIVSVSVLRTENSKKGVGSVGEKSRKSLSETAGSGEKTVAADKKVTTDSVTTLLSQPFKEPVAFEKNIQGVSKADLVRELKEQGSSEILREAKILVKDGQSGEIKLILRPQELGTVKINLILENKHIVGKIFVDNNIVKDALQTAFGDLKEVFAEQGMELGALDVFVSQESKQDNVFSDHEEIDVTPLKIARAVGAVEKHAEIIRSRYEGSGIDIEV
ncbi:MAG: flagellar hook-length control protein FliK [Spirochaetia bacterium]|nr:flagellar hook-length control protein FliK [Spirochaetia bacterium]